MYARFINVLWDWLVYFGREMTRAAMGAIGGADAWVDRCAFDPLGEEQWPDRALGIESATGRRMMRVDRLADRDPFGAIARSHTQARDGGQQRSGVGMARIAETAAASGRSRRYGRCA
jgi:hypothetical protein